MAGHSGEIAIVIPTFNEKENIKDLILAIFKVLPDAHVIVVDDNSPDGTAGIVQDIADDRVHLVVRSKKNGRGGAVLDGIGYALRSRSDYQKIIEMDADFSHDPGQLTSILNKAQSYDVVVGSRYQKGSKIIDWSRQRKIFSYLANKFARFLLKVPITDYTNGYRCYSRKAAAGIPVERISSTGYVVLSEIALCLHKQKFTFGEVPITFVNRQRGLSKLSAKEIWSAFFSLLRLGLTNNFNRTWTTPS